VPPEDIPTPEPPRPVVGVDPPAWPEPPVFVGAPPVATGDTEAPPELLTAPPEPDVGLLIAPPVLLLDEPPLPT
jgi:hypothetical protein